MSLSSTQQKVQYTGNGATTLYVVPFYFLANTDLVVITTDTSGTNTVKVLTTDYTLVGAGVPSGGGLTFGVAPTNGHRITIMRVVPLTQLLDYVNNDAFPADTHEQALDRLTMVCQQLLEVVSRCIQIPQGEASAIVVTLPKLSSRASKAVAFDASGNVIVQ